MSISTFDRLGEEMQFASLVELHEYFNENNFINVKVVPWSQSKIKAYVEAEYATSTEEDNLIALVGEDNYDRIVKGEELLVIEKDDCDDESDVGCEFMFK
jgi:hypothetical protein